MNWVILCIAGMLEVVWAVGLKRTAGFTKPIPSLVTVAAIIASFYLLSLALRGLPLGSAYAIWVGIGAVGTVAASAWLFGKPLSLLKIVSVALVVFGIVGLRLSATS